MNRGTLRPAYLKRRLAAKMYQRQHPDHPWLAPNAIAVLDSWLRPTDRALEWGSGRSTCWIAQRVGHMVSIESHRGWYDSVRTMLASAGVAGKVDYRFIQTAANTDTRGDDDPYIHAADDIADGSIDFALVDGMAREGCFRVAIRKVKPGGILALDNANWFIPNAVNGSHSTVVHYRSQPREGFEDAWREVSGWRSIHTTDGINDTRLWVKP